MLRENKFHIKYKVDYSVSKKNTDLSNSQSNPRQNLIMTVSGHGIKLLICTGQHIFFLLLFPLPASITFTPLHKNVRAFRAGRRHN